MRTVTVRCGGTGVLGGGRGSNRACAPRLREQQSMRQGLKRATGHANPGLREQQQGTHPRSAMLATPAELCTMLAATETV